MKLSANLLVLKTLWHWLWNTWSSLWNWSRWKSERIEMCTIREACGTKKMLWKSLRRKGWNCSKEHRKQQCFGEHQMANRAVERGKQFCTPVSFIVVIAGKKNKTPTSHKSQKKAPPYIIPPSPYGRINWC